MFLILVQYLSKKEKQLEWLETNAKIVKSVLSTNTWGTELSHASDRLDKLTIEIPLNNGETAVSTKKIWIYTKNRNMFREGNYVSFCIIKRNQNNSN